MGDEDLEARVDMFCQLIQELYMGARPADHLPETVLVKSRAFDDLVAAAIDWRGYIVPADRSAILNGTWKEKTPTE